MRLSAFCVALLVCLPASAQRPLPLPPPWPDTVPPPAERAPAPQGERRAVPPAPPPPPPAPREQPVPVRAADAPRGPVTGLPLPRYASLGSNRINLRTGPGTQYPVEWTYQRSGWPVEIVREFSIWRRVRDQDGAEGWVQQSFLSGRRSFVVRGETRGLRRRGDEAAPVIARLAPGVQGRIRRCEAGSEWCEVEVRGNRGWLHRAWFWGTYQGEEVK
ncbi:SH3 domain-containing protein [Elioraea rosea]|uniref:SH3 domain-containing protein n=1 Tax=Elioraea rosea TaxID=2492390 RepID=UPI001183FC5B|nr:SH3 domain-containing protein [Elioraea rosea]